MAFYAQKAFYVQVSVQQYLTLFVSNTQAEWPYVCRICRCLMTYLHIEVSHYNYKFALLNFLRGRHVLIKWLGLFVFSSAGLYKPSTGCICFLV